MKKKQQRYTTEFRAEAVKLHNLSTISVANESGIGKRKDRITAQLKYESRTDGNGEGEVDSNGGHESAGAVEEGARLKLLGFEKTVALLLSSYEQSGITLRVVNHGTIPMSGFAREFFQVILNILNNAKDVLVERGTAEPVVFIECHCEDGSRNVIKIRDNARGIPQAILDTIFDPYFTTKFKSQGTGLGLYMSKMIIENIMGEALRT